MADIPKGSEKGEAPDVTASHADLQVKGRYLPQVVRIATRDWK